MTLAMLFGIYVISSIMYGIYTYVESIESYKNYKEGKLDLISEYMKQEIQFMIEGSKDETEEEAEYNIIFAFKVTAIIYGVNGIPSFIMKKITKIIMHTASFFKKKESK